MLRHEMVFALAAALAGCGGYQRVWVERPPLVAVPAEVPRLELVDVHLAGVRSSPSELLAMRTQTLPVLQENVRKTLGREAALAPAFAKDVAPIADAWRGCVADALPQDGAWKMALAVSEHTREPNSILAPLLASKSYLVTVAIAVWDENDRLVDHERVTFTKDEDGGVATHMAAPFDDGRVDVSIESAGSFGDPLWLKAIDAALPEYLARFRTSRVRRIVFDGKRYEEPRDRIAYRQAHEARPVSPRCSAP